MTNFTPLPFGLSVATGISRTRPSPVLAHPHYHIRRAAQATKRHPCATHHPGRRVGMLDAKDHVPDKRDLLRLAVESYQRLAPGCGWMVIEAAGSHAQANVRAPDIA